MSAIPSIPVTKAIIQAASETESYQVGSEYYRDGRVLEVSRTGPTKLVARVRGSRYVPYEVDLRVQGGEVTAARCDCPRYSGSWCRHIVAVLLACSEADSGLRTQLASASREALETLLMELAEESDAVAEKVRQLG